MSFALCSVNKACFWMVSLVSQIPLILLCNFLVPMSNSLFKVLHDPSPVNCSVVQNMPCQGCEQHRHENFPVRKTHLMQHRLQNIIYPLAKLTYFPMNSPFSFPPTATGHQRVNTHRVDGISFWATLCSSFPQASYVRAWRPSTSLVPDHHNDQGRKTWPFNHTASVFPC